MWPKATNVLEEFYYHWRMERGEGGGGGCRGEAYHFLGGGVWLCYVCAPATFNPTFLFST